MRVAAVAAGVAALGLALLLGACSDSSTPTEPSGGGGSFALQRATEHFTLRYDAATASTVDGYAAALEESWARIAADLGVASLSRIEGFLHPTRASFTATTGYNATGSVDGPTRFHIVAVPLTPPLAVHELAHNVTLHLSPSAANNPTWLWEAVAVYEARQLVPPSSLPYLVAGDFPSLAALNDRNGRYSIYDVGYTLAEFVVDRWGLAGLRQLVLAAGDTQRALGVTAEAFTQGWKEFVTRRYLGPAPADSRTRFSSEAKRGSSRSESKDGSEPSR